MNLIVDLLSLLLAEYNGKAYKQLSQHIWLGCSTHDATTHATHHASRTTQHTRYTTPGNGKGRHTTDDGQTGRGSQAARSDWRHNGDSGAIHQHGGHHFRAWYFHGSVPRPCRNSVATPRPVGRTPQRSLLKKARIRIRLPAGTQRRRLGLRRSRYANPGGPTLDLKWL